MESICVTRNRFWIGISVVVVIVLGIGSRQYPLFPTILGKYPGDSLWALMVFLGLAFLKPKAPTRHLSGLALVISCMVELSQLYQAPLINAIRGTTMGHLVLGSTFSWFDIPAYALGVWAGSFLDSLLVARQASNPIEKTHE